MPSHVRISVLLMAAALAACGTDSTGSPGLISTGPAVMELFDPPLEVNVLQRSTPLARDYTASATIGSSGGTIGIPEAGFTITFPRDAVKAPTLITVTAPAGSGVAYEFQPHGQAFGSKPTITQDLRGTGAYRNPSSLVLLQGAYFLDARSLQGVVARVLETRPTVVDPLSWKMRFTIQHFSGYLIASGRSDSGYISSSGNLAPVQH